MKRRKIKFTLLGLTLGLCSLSLLSCGENTDKTSSTPSTVVDPVKEKVTVSFESQGVLISTSQEGYPGDAMTLPTPTMEGYKFSGWYSDSTLTNQYTSTKFPDASMTLYAKFDAIYHNITFVYNNGLKSETKALIEASTVEVSSPTLNGAAFAGWYTDEALENKFTGKVPGSDTKLYAKWTLEQGTVYVSPTGTAEGDGSVSSPLNFETALSRMKSSEIEATQVNNILVLSGEYKFSARQIVDTDMGGKYNERKTITGVDGDNLATFNFEELDYGTRGFDIRANYVHVSNLIVEKAGAYGIYVGGSHNIVENCVTRYNRNTGLGIARWDSSQDSLDKYPSDNLILRCTSHDNFDFNGGGEDADGFTAKLTAGHNNVFDSCIAFGNSDDGWDLYSKSDSGNTGVTKIINCVAFRNGFLSDTANVNNEASPYASIGRTRDGDGNGFKLGGEVMYTNVYLENCISFENGAHGFTDNSNPGILALKNCTSFNNGLFEAGRYANYNLARTQDSLNTYEGILSVTTNGMITADNEDEFRGPISSSIVLQQNANQDALVFNGITSVINGNSRVDELSGSEISLDPTKIFASTDSTAFYTQTVEKANEIHNVLRNQDGSVNLGDFLKITDATVLAYNNGKSIGGSLSASANEDYSHHISLEIPQEANADTILSYEIYNQLYIVCREDAVYEDLDLYKTIMGNAITWSSSNTDVIVIDTENKNPKDSSKGTDTYYWGKVINPETDTKVTITATIVVGDVTLTKDFEVTVKALTPLMGDVIEADDVVIYQGDELPEINPQVLDLNSRIENGVISSDLLTISKKIFYTLEGNEIEISTISKTLPGVYRIEYTISLNGTDSVKVKNVEVEILNALEPIEIRNNQALINGVEIETSWKLGTAYLVAVASDSAIPTAEQVKAGVTYTADDKIVEVVRSQSVSVTDFTSTIKFETPLYGDYTYYLTVENNGVLSDVYSVDAIDPIYINTKDELYALSQRNVLATENIVLNADIDLTGFTWTVTEGVTFATTFDGNGHTISNLTINYDGTLYAGLFTETVDATIFNLNLANVSITAPNSTGAAALIGKASSTTVTNVKVTNVAVKGLEGIGGLIGQTSAGNIYISRVSVTNTNTALLIEATKRYAGGLVGCFMGGPTDDAYNEIIMTDVYANVNVKCGSSGYAGGFVGRIKGNQNRYLKVLRGFYDGTITGKYAGATTGGSDKNVAGCKIDLTNVVTFGTIATSNSGNGTMYGRIQSNTLLGLTAKDTYFVLRTDASNQKASKAIQNANTVLNEVDFTESFCASLFDLETTWNFENGILSLK